MRKTDLLAAAACAAALAAPAALADDAEVLSHYDAYDQAMSQLRYDVAITEADAAWRAATREWGEGEDTGVLAFNIVRLRLMADQRDEALEPAESLKRMVDAGQVSSVKPEEADLFLKLARFNDAHAERGQNRELEDALNAFTPTDYVSTRIDWLGWAHVANAAFALDDWRPAYDAAEKAGSMMAMDPTAPLLLTTTVARVGARAGYEIRNYEGAIAAAQRGIAAFPAQPKGQELDPMLPPLLIWNQGLMQVYAQTEGHPYTASPDFAWDDGRYPNPQACQIKWSEQEFPRPRRGGPRPAGLGSVFEYSFAADGSVADVELVGEPPAEGEPSFADTLRSWKAEPMSADCRGPWLWVSAFLPNNQPRSLH